MTREKKAPRLPSGTITILILLSVCLLFHPITLEAEEWGQIMIAPEKTNIRAQRAVNSKLKGTLPAGKIIKADFPDNNWVAVFELGETKRSEDRALGYVFAPRLQAVAATDKEAPGATRETEMLEVRAIRYILKENSREQVFFALSRFADPDVQVIKGDRPRLVIDFKNVSSIDKDLPNIIEVNGTLIQRIRSYLNQKKQTFRIVFDLYPGKDYAVRQMFYEAEKIFALTLSEDTIRETP